MKRLGSGLLLLCVLFIASDCGSLSVVDASYETLSTLGEFVSVSVNCTSSQVSVNSMIVSGNTSLIDFPSGVDMSDPNLLNVTTLSVSFSSNQSSLVYTFNDTDASAAESMADGVTPTLGTAFQTTFAFVSASSSGSEVNVTYSGAGKSNLSQYAQSLMTNDLWPDLRGTSLTFLPMSHNGNAFMTMGGTKDVGMFDWIFDMTVSYTTNLSVGPGNHEVDVLALLGVSSLAPSSYAYASGLYGSGVYIDVVNGTVSFVASDPGLASLPSRGWTISSGIDSLTCLFYFGSNASAVGALTLTFSGTVISELTGMGLLFVLMLSASIVLIPRKRIRRMQP